MIGQQMRPMVPNQPYTSMQQPQARASMLLFPSASLNLSVFRTKWLIMVLLVLYVNFYLDYHNYRAFPDQIACFCTAQ